MTNDNTRFTFTDYEIAVILDALRRVSLTCNDRDGQAFECERLITKIVGKVKDERRRMWMCNVYEKAE